MTNPPTHSAKPSKALNPIRWAEGPLSIRFQGKRYVVSLRIEGSRGAPKAMAKLHTLDQAIEQAEALYKRWAAGEALESLKEKDTRLKAEAAAGQLVAVPVSSHGSSVESKPTMYRVEGSDEWVTESQVRRLYPWSSARFTFVDCNSVAVIWQCTKYENERGAGRFSKTGNHQEGVPHRKGDFAVSYIEYHREAVADCVRDIHGRVRVFETLAEAEEFAEYRYHMAPEDDKFPIVDTGPNVRKFVTSYANYDIYADTTNNGYKYPFDIWINLTSTSGKFLYKDVGGEVPRIFATLEGAYNTAIQSYNRHFRG